MKTPKNTPNLQLADTCVSISVSKWQEYMSNTKKANGKQIRSLIKKYLPELYNDLCLNFYNPYEHKSVKKQGLLVYVHSGIEYFLTY